MAEDKDKIKQAPEQEEFKVRDAACSPEFSNEGCKFPPESDEE